MKICFISDTHSLHSKQLVEKIPECDVLVHSGDFTNVGEYADVSNFCDWLDTIEQARHKIVIAGNHDFCCEIRNPNYKKTWDRLRKSCNYLFDTDIILEGVKFYGSPWQPQYHNWAFNLPRSGQGLFHCWNLIPHDVDVLITHGPPKTILDKTYNQQNVGCEFLKDRVETIAPAIHAFGHVHESYGHFQDAVLGTLFVNSSICDHLNVPINNPIVVEYLLEDDIAEVV